MWIVDDVPKTDGIFPYPALRKYLGYTYVTIEYAASERAGGRKIEMSADLRTADNVAAAASPRAPPSLAWLRSARGRRQERTLMRH